MSPLPRGFVALCRFVVQHAFTIRAVVRATLRRLWSFGASGLIALVAALTTSAVWAAAGLPGSWVFDVAFWSALASQWAVLIVLIADDVAGV